MATTESQTLTTLRLAAMALRFAAADSEHLNLTGAKAALYEGHAHALEALIGEAGPGQEPGTSGPSSDTPGQTG